MDDPVARHGITHQVAGKCAALARLECVLVNPLAIRSASLLVHKAARRLPGANARAPAQWKAMQSDPVLNHRSLAHDDRLRRENPEIQPRRSDGSEIGGIAEERKHFGWRPRNQSSVLNSRFIMLLSALRLRTSPGSKARRQCRNSGPILIEIHWRVQDAAAGRLASLMKVRLPMPGGLRREWPDWRYRGCGRE